MTAAQGQMQNDQCAMTDYATSTCGWRHGQHEDVPARATPRPGYAGRRLSSDLDHLEVFLARAALGARPVDGNVFPARARRNTLVRQTGFFVVNPAANQAHPALIFHSCIAS